MARVLGVVVTVSCSNTEHRMRQLCFLDSCMCLGGWYSLGRSKSLSISPSQQTWLDTLPRTYWFHLHRLHPNRLYLILCGFCVAPFQFSRWYDCFKSSLVCLFRIIYFLSQAEYGSRCYDCGIITIWCMVNSTCIRLDLGEQPNSILCQRLGDILWVSLQFDLKFWGELFPN